MKNKFDFYKKILYNIYRKLKKRGFENERKNEYTNSSY